MTEEDRHVLASFGARLKELRDQVDISQEALSLKSGVARSYLSGVERGKRNIAVINIAKLARALGVPTSELFRF